MTGRTRLEEHESPVEGRAPGARETPANLPGSPEALLALQRSAGNQATTAMLARMGNDGDGGGQGGGWYLDGTWLRGWLVYLRLMSPPAAPATVTAPGPESGAEIPEGYESESESEDESGYETAPEGEPEVTAQTTAPKAPTPLSDGERRDLITQRRKLEDAAETFERDAAREVRILCHTIDKLLAKTTVSDAELQELEEAIHTTLQRASKGKQKEKRHVTSSSSMETETKTESAPAGRPVVILYGSKIGAAQAGWGSYGDVLAQVIGELTSGGLTLGKDFKPVLRITVGGHWQEGKGGHHFIKVYLDEADMGTGTVIRGYFRYRIFRDRIVLKLVAIVREHGGHDKTEAGNILEFIGEDGT
jgi:hypothetical protein